MREFFLVPAVTRVKRSIQPLALKCCAQVSKHTANMLCSWAQGQGQLEGIPALSRLSGMESNPRPSCSEAAARTTAPSCQLVTSQIKELIIDFSGTAFSPLFAGVNPLRKKNQPKKKPCILFYLHFKRKPPKRHFVRNNSQSVTCLTSFWIFDWIKLPETGRDLVRNCERLEGFPI